MIRSRFKKVEGQKDNAPRKVRKYKPIGMGWFKRGPSGVRYTSCKIPASGVRWMMHVLNNKKSGFVNITIMPSKTKGGAPLTVFQPYWGEK